MDDRNVKMLSSFTNAMCSSKISANTHCDTRLKISYVPQEKEPPWLGLSCLILLQGGLHSKVGPILPQFFPATIPKYDETATSSTALTRMCEHPPHLALLSTDCTFVNKLLVNTIIIFFNAFLTVVALTTNFQLAHKYFHLSLLHALCLLEPQTSLKNHAHLLLLHEVQLHHVLPYPQPSVLIGVIIKHTVPHSFILGRQWKHEDPRNLSPGFSSVSTFDATEMTRRRFHPLHSKHELFRWNSHCFVTCAPLDLAMHYPWCYIATRKILISNKHIANFGLQIFCPQISSCSTPRLCGFPKYLRTKYACLLTYSSRKWI